MPFPLDTVMSATADRMLLHNANASLQADPTKLYTHVPTDEWRDGFVQKFRDFRVVSLLFTTLTCSHSYIPCNRN
jgi:hypothetical protein